ncbi:uridine kinase [Sesbania bispinosa]|nr:uridine kinase [Sesbania bispinosa]
MDLGRQEREQRQRVRQPSCCKGKQKSISESSSLFTGSPMQDNHCHASAKMAMITIVAGVEGVEAEVAEEGPSEMVGEYERDAVRGWERGWK